jgi:phosphoglycolate phosphatase
MLCSAFATAQYMSSIGFNKKAYVIGSKVLSEELEAVGISTLGSGPDISDESLLKQVMKDLKKIDEDVGAVVVGFDQHFSFPKLFKAVNYLKESSIGKNIKILKFGLVKNFNI